MEHQMKRIIRAVAPVLLGVALAVSVIGFVIVLAQHFPA